MKKFLNILFIMFSLLLFTQKVAAQDIPKGDYSVEEIFHLNISVVDQAGNKLKEIYLCYIGEGCNKMTLQSDGLYKRDINSKYNVNNTTFSDRTNTKKVNIYIKATGYIASQSYSIEEITTSKYTLNGKNVTDEFTKSFTGLNKVTLVKKDSAKKCSVINGKGNMIGDEVKCGTESFYIIGKEGDNYKLFSKYNLYAGYNQYNVYLSNTYDTINETGIYNYDSNGNYESIEWSTDNEEVEALIEKNYESGDYHGYDFIYEYYDESYKLDLTNVTGIKLKKCTYYSGGGSSCSIDEKTGLLSESIPSVIVTSTNTYDNQNNTWTYKRTIENDEINALIEKYITNGEYNEYDLLYESSKEISRTNKYHNMKAITFYNGIDEDDPLYGKQNELAIGAHGDTKGNPEPYEYGNISIYYYSSDTSVDYNYSGGYYDISGENYYFDDYILDYENYLDTEGFNTGTVRMPTLTDINTLIKDLSGSELPLETWYNEWYNTGEIRYDELHESYYSVLGSIKDQLAGKYSWIYNTTYLLNTYSYSDKESKDNEYNWKREYAYFIDTLGELCNTKTCMSYIGAGIRPIVYMPVETYTVDTKTDGHGQITYNIVNGAVVFTITPDEGYVLGVAIVTDSEGNKLEFTNNTFTMPNADVTIEATFLKVENPVTSSSGKIIILCSITILLATFIITSRRKLHI